MASWFRLWRTAILLGTLLCVVSPATAAGAKEPPQRVVVPMDTSIFDPCTNEFVHLEGSEMFIERFEDSGSFLVKVVSHFDAVGEETGARYIAKEHLTQTVVWAHGITGGKLSATAVVTVSLISPGPDPDLHFRFFSHITQNNAGEVTADRTVRDESCRG